MMGNVYDTTVGRKTMQTVYGFICQQEKYIYCSMKGKKIDNATIQNVNHYFP